MYSLRGAPCLQKRPVYSRPVLTPYCSRLVGQNDVTTLLSGLGYYMAETIAPTSHVCPSRFVEDPQVILARCNWPSPGHTASTASPTLHAAQRPFTMLSKQCGIENVF